MQNLDTGAGYQVSVLATNGGANFLVAFDLLFLYPIGHHEAELRIA
jgi:hypothetical protein